MATHMQQRRGTAAQWTVANPVLADGEIGFERDTGKIKIGDGVTAWNSLTYKLLDKATADGLYATSASISSAVAAEVTRADGKYLDSTTASATYAAVPATKNTAVAVVQDEAPPTPQRHGATGNGTTDDTTALQAWLAAGYTAGLLPPGTYKTTATLSLPNGMAVRGSKNAKIKAGGSMAALVDTPLATQVRNTSIEAVILDCNNLATVGLYPRWFAEFGIRDVEVWDAAGDAVTLGDTASTDTSYGVFARGVRVDRPQRGAKVASSRALYLQKVTDCKIMHAELIGCDVGVRVEGGGHQFQMVNAWGYSNSLPTTCFDDNGSGTDWIGCTAETPTSYGFRLRALNSKILGGRTYLNSSYGVDNTVIAVQVDPTTAYFTVIGHHFQGNDSTHRLAKDIATTDSNNPIIVGNQYTNVVTMLSPQNRFPAGLTVVGGLTSNNQISVFRDLLLFATAGTARNIAWGTGGSVAGSSTRWQAGADATAESGSNAGSNWTLTSRTDAAAFLATVLTAYRANGVVQAASGGFATKVKSGTPSDADFATAPPDGTIVADNSGSKIWVRVGGAWKSATLA